MLKHLPSLNITQKFIGFYFVTSLLPLLVVGITSYHVSSLIIREEAARYTSELVQNKVDNLELQLRQVESLIARISENEEVYEVITDEKAASGVYTSLANQARLKQIMSGYDNLDGLVSIDIFTTAEIQYHIGDSLDGSGVRTAVKADIFAKTLQSGKRTAWTGVVDNVNEGSQNSRVITAASILMEVDPKTGQGRPAALLLVNYSLDYLYDQFSSVVQGQGAYLLAIDDQNRLIYHPQKSLRGTQLDPNLTRKLTGGRGNFVDTIDGQAMLVAYNRSLLNQWVVLDLIPVETPMAKIRTIGQTTLVLLLISFGFITLSVWVLSQEMLAPIRRITRQFKLFKEDALDWDTRLPEGRQDEIGELVKWFNTFLESLKAKRDAEEALRVSEERYSLAVQGANDGIWDWDLRSGRVYYSSRWKAMLGYEESEIGDSPNEWLDRIHAEDVEQVKKEVDAHLDGATYHFESEHRILRQGGESYCWVLARGLAVRDASRNAYRMAGSLTDISAIKETEERLRHKAMYDALTNLPNRSYFMDQLRRSIERVRRRPYHQAAVLFMDLDRFKIVNDSLGHICGDQMLVGIAHRLQASLRSGDMVARFGGDEFAILLEDVKGINEVTLVAKRIRQALSLPFDLEGHQVFATASIGIAWVAARYERPEDLLRDADTAMYQAKTNGRARYEVFHTEMHAHNLAVLNLEADLRQAIKREEFTLYYQPIVSAAGGRILSVEALLRWQHSRRGLVFPGEFIALAEETGLIVPIGEWVLEAACRQAKAWDDAGHSGLTVSVNISARQLQNERLLRFLKKSIKEAGIAPQSLQLEITESTAMRDLDLTAKTLTSLSKMGVQIAIDDFGTSYSSLSYLKRFPISSIKIDKTFTQDVTSDADDAAIVSAVISMARTLDLKTVAEGVETEGQLSFLVKEGCDAVQGFLVSPPVPVEKVSEFLEQKCLLLPKGIVHP